MIVWFNESPSALAAAIWRRNYSSCAFIFTTSRLIQDLTTLSAKKYFWFVDFANGKISLENKSVLKYKATANYYFCSRWWIQYACERGIETEKNIQVITP